MENVFAKRNFRGKGQSTTKFTKAGEPKRSGNWSSQTIHHQSLQYKDYYVRLLQSESGIKILLVGDHTPLARIMGDAIEELAINDENFSVYVQAGEYKGLGNGKSYEARRTLRKLNVRKSWYFDNRAFLYREEIYTDGDFTYNFPEY